MLYTIIEYIKFIFTSTNQHGIHSPFVYDLVTKCFYNRTYDANNEKILNYRNLLINNKSFITIQDLGAGSKVLSTNSRRVSNISKNAGIPYRRAKLLYRITKYFQPDSILELGTSLGMATCSLSLGTPKARIITIEGCPETASIAQAQFQLFKLNNINLIINKFDNELNTLKKKNFDLIYFDGNHHKEATISYYNILAQTVNNDSIMIFDDIHWSKGMTEAWEIIKQDPKVTLTIDTFHWGFVFFRKEQEKQHFKIRL